MSRLRDARIDPMLRIHGRIGARLGSETHPYNDKKDTPGAGWVNPIYVYIDGKTET